MSPIWSAVAPVGTVTTTLPWPELCFGWKRRKANAAAAIARPRARIAPIRRSQRRRGLTSSLRYGGEAGRPGRGRGPPPPPSPPPPRPLRAGPAGAAPPPAAGWGGGGVRGGPGAPPPAPAADGRGARGGPAAGRPRP